MKTTSQEKLDKRFNEFVSSHFEMPNNCQNLDLIKYYTSEIYALIEDFDQKFKSVPLAAFTLLSDYLAQAKCIDAKQAA